MGKKPRFILIYLIIAMMLIFGLSQVFRGKVYTLDYGEFKDYLRNGHILEMEIGREEVIGKIEIPTRDEDTNARQNDPEVLITDSNLKDDTNGVSGHQQQPQTWESSVDKKPPAESRIGKNRNKLPPLPLGKKVSFITKRILPLEKLQQEAENLGIPHRTMPESNFTYFMPFPPFALK